MKKRFNLLTVSLIIIASLMLSSCAKKGAEASGENSINEFRANVDSFCAAIADTDSKINSIDTSSDSYVTDITGLLNSLNTSFSEFASLEFPEEYEYLKHLAVEASDYMSQAVTLYNQVYTDGSLSEDELRAKYDEATTLYNNAFKRIKVIMTFLNGEISEDANVQTESSGTLTEP